MYSAWYLFPPSQQKLILSLKVMTHSDILSQREGNCWPKQCSQHFSSALVFSVDNKVCYFVCWEFILFVIPHCFLSLSAPENTNPHLQWKDLFQNEITGLQLLFIIGYTFTFNFTLFLSKNRFLFVKHYILIIFWNKHSITIKPSSKLLVYSVKIWIMLFCGSGITTTVCSESGITAPKNESPTNMTHGFNLFY